uniref:Uncharacterized protein n=1 Tax=Arundo donax TaxID=35708 RepID=A0A0A9FEJ5_ARUDO
MEGDLLSPAPTLLLGSGWIGAGRRRGEERCLFSWERSEELSG